MTTLATEESVRISRSATRLVLHWAHGVEVEFEMHDDTLAGIRGVSHRAIPLRNRGVLWRPLLTTTDGIQYPRLELTTVQQSADGRIDLVCSAHGYRTRMRETQDEYKSELLDLTPDAPIVDRLTWSLWPCEADYAGTSFDGFAYAYRLESAGRNLHRLFDLATWEIGGGVEGNTLLFQGQLNPPAFELTIDSYYTTECSYYGAEMRASLRPGQYTSMQRLPRVATIQSFDMLHHRDGILIGDFASATGIASVLQKEAGEDCLHIVDEHRAPCDRSLTTVPKRILFHHTDGALPREAYRNLWQRILDSVHERERSTPAIARSGVRPHVWLPQINRDHFRLCGKHGRRTDYLRFMADEVVPRWAEMGAKAIITPSLWRSDYTEMRFTCKNDTGLQGGFTVSGICCVHEHAISPLYGGAEALAYLVDKAHAHGLLVQLWWATHLSRRAPIFKAHPEWMIRSRDSMPGCGGIGKEVIVPLDLNNPDCYAWELECLRKVYDATGVDGVFHDSYGNYTFLPVNYADPLLRDQQQAYARLVHDLQTMGLREFMVEGIGPWGVGHFGMQLAPTDGSGSYQNALDWWLGHEDMIYGLDMGIHAHLWPDRDDEARAFAFRCIASGGRFGFTQTEGGVEMWSGWLRELNQMHARIAPLTGERLMLPDDRGMLWQNTAHGDLLFAYRPFSFPAAGRRIEQLRGRETLPIAPTASLQTELLTLYRLR